MKIKKIVLLCFLISGLNIANATTVADVANGLVPQLGNGVAPMLEALSYIFGIVLGIKGVLKLKEVNETRGQTKIHTAIVFLIAAALFLSLPKLIDVGIGTFGFDQGGQSTFKF